MSEPAPRIVSLSPDQLQPHPLNPRGPITAEGIADLKASMQVHGQKQPCVVMRREGPEAAYYTVIGHRRVEACRSLEIPVLCIIEDLADDEAVAIMVSDNEVREDVDPFLEAKAVGTLLGRPGWTLKSVADALGKSPRWVAQRANLLNLSPAWKKLLKGDPKVHGEQLHEKVKLWPISWLERVATLSHTVQDSLIGECRWIEDLNDLDQQIAQHTRELANAPWDLGDATLHPEAGSCAACPKQSGKQPGLFDDGTQEVPLKKCVCLDAACWKKKLNAHGKIRLEELRAKHPGLIVVEGEWTSDAELREPIPTPGAKPLACYNVTPAKKADKGAVPALVNQGKGRGSVIWVKVKPSAKPAAPTKEKPLSPKEQAAKAKREVKERREAFVFEKFEEVLRKAPCPSGNPGISASLLALAAVYGVQPPWARGPEEKRRVKLLRGSIGLTAVDEKVLDLLWAGVKEQLLDDPSYWEQDLELVAEACDIDLAPIQAQAKEKIPDPKKVKPLPPAKAKKGAKASGKKGAKKKAPKPSADEDLDGEARCRKCGCTEGRPCKGGCTWVDDGGMEDICSRCVEPDDGPGDEEGGEDLPDTDGGPDDGGE